MPKELGLLVIVKDERENLEKHLAPAFRFFDEVVVGDTGSTDGTFEFLSSMGVEVFRIEWKGFSHARNQVLSRMESRWVVFLDADEEIDEDGVKRLREAVRGKEKGVFSVILDDGGSLSYQIRVFRRKGVRFEGKVHEQLVYPPDWPLFHTGVVVRHFGYKNQKQLRKKLLRNLALLDGDDPYQAFHRGKILFKLGRLREALCEYRSFFDRCGKKGINPELVAAASLDVSDILRRLGDLKGSLRVLVDAKEQFPEFFPFLFALGKRYMELGDKKKAEEMFRAFLSAEKTVKSVPINIGAMEKLARVYLEKLRDEV